MGSKKKENELYNGALIDSLCEELEGMLENFKTDWSGVNKNKQYITGVEGGKKDIILKTEDLQKQVSEIEKKIQEEAQKQTTPTFVLGRTPK